jgi:ribonuclease BN (tRNA processing enzyme)
VAGEAIILDAGSGILAAPVEFDHVPCIILTHLHVDHLMGLGMYPRLSKKGERTSIYVPASSHKEAESSLELLYSRPLWPVSLKGYAGQLRFAPVPETLHVGKVTIETIEGSHPGGCKVVKISCGDKVLVYATDFEHEQEATARLAEFADGADLLLYDGQYTSDAYEAHRGFGHSTAEEGVRLMERAGISRLVVVHHDPGATDAELAERERVFADKRVSFAREGEVIEL